MKLKLPNISPAIYKLQGFIITMILLTAKIAGWIDIGWIWVFGAYWIPLVIFFGMIIVAGIVLVLFFLLMLLLEALRLL